MARKNNTASIRYKYAQISYNAREAYKKLVKAVPAASSVSRYNLSHFPTLGELGNISETELTAKYYKIRNIMKSGQLSVRRTRRFISSALESIGEKYQGQDFIDPENAEQLFRFLDDARAAGLGSVYGYIELLQEFSKAARAGLTAEQIRLNIGYYQRQIANEGAAAARQGRQPMYRQLDFSKQRAGYQKISVAAQKRAGTNASSYRKVTETRANRRK